MRARPREGKAGAIGTSFAWAEVPVTLAVNNTARQLAHADRDARTGGGREAGSITLRVRMITQSVYRIPVRLVKASRSPTWKRTSVRCLFAVIRGPVELTMQLVPRIRNLVCPGGSAIA